MYVNQKEPTTLVNLPAGQLAEQRRGFQFRFSERRTLLILVDALVVALAAWGAAVLWLQPVDWSPLGSDLSAYRYWFPLLLGGWWFLAWLNDLYDVPTSDNTRLSAIRIIIAGGISLLSYLFIHLFVPGTPHPLLFAYYLALVLPAIAWWRWLYAVVFDRPPFLHRLLIVGGGQRGNMLADILCQRAGVSGKVMGYVDDNAGGEGGLLEGVPRLGREADLAQLTEELRVNEIVIAKEQELDSSLFQALVDCQARGVRVCWMPDLYGKYYRQIPMEYVDPAWALYAMQGRRIFNRLQQLSKRLVDLVLVLLALPFLLLIFLPIAVAIRLDSSGPIFYRQIRSGRGNKPFCIFKFRTMYVDAEKDGKARWAQENDPRITRVGHFLRKSRLDELPQILNVLRGEMSLVGPRPERPEFVEVLQEEVPFYSTRLTVKPGLTGWAQIHYDYGNSAEDAVVKLQYDFYYIHHWSLWLDLYILYRTLGVVALFKGT